MSLKITQHMTRKLLNLSKIALLVFSISFLFGSCTKENTYFVDPQGDFAIVLNEFVNIKRSDWNWNANNNRYEAIVSYPELSAEEFNDGALVAGVFIPVGSSTTERLESLPYVKTWYVDSDVFTETISCALEYPTKSIIFSIQASDLAKDDDARQDYEFKVAIIKNFTY